MENNTPSNMSPIPKWFWVVAIIALLWYLMDMSTFVMRVFMLEQMLQSMPDAQKTLYLAMPSWVNGIFAAEVFGGVLGCVALLLRKKWALPLFCISIVGVLCQTFYIYFLSDAIRIMGAPAIVMPLVAIVIGVGMIVLARVSMSEGWS